MKKSYIPVDFNEMVEKDLVLLSKEDYKNDSDGNVIHLYEGLHIHIYTDESGKIDNLIASGIVEQNKIKSGWGVIAKWCCRIDSKGIQPESDIK